MTNLSDVYVAGAGASVTVLNDQTFNSSGTWTKPTGIQYAPDDMALIELWGAGQGGGFASTSADAVSGGYGGAYVRYVLPVSALSATQSVIIGAGGAGAPPSASSGAGSAGGTTSFAGIRAPGGSGGGSIAAVSNSLIRHALRQVGIYTPGDGANAPGNSSAGAKEAQVSIVGGSGGHTVLTGGNRAGQPGLAPGGGGGASNGGGISGAAGGAGAPGRVRVRLLRGLNNFEISEGPM